LPGLDGSGRVDSDSHIRFKRSVEHRAHGAYPDGDPYRPQVGMSPNRW
jgi:hypothetical protein